MNVLILENDRLLNMAVSIGLKSNKYKVYSCFNESKATEILRSIKIDLIIYDLAENQMPAGSFLTDTENNVKCNIPIIFISVLEYTQTGIDRCNFNKITFFKKPVDPDLILEQVKQIEFR